MSREVDLFRLSSWHESECLGLERFEMSVSIRSSRFGGGGAGFVRTFTGRELQRFDELPVGQ